MIFQSFASTINVVVSKSFEEFTMFRKFGFAAIVCTILTSPAIADCTGVFEGAIQTLSIKVTQASNRAMLYSLHCKKDGSVRSKSTSGAFSAVYEAVKLGMSLSGNSSEERQAEFCKIGNEQNFSQTSSLAVERHNAEGALETFVQCRALEERGLILSHQISPPGQFTVFGEFKSGVSGPTVDIVGFEPSHMDCVASAGEKVKGKVLDGLLGFDPSGRNFSIFCRRKQSVVGDTKIYEKTSFQLGTSHGLYTIDLPSDYFPGFQLASEAQANYADAVLAKEDADRKAAAALSLIPAKVAEGIRSVTPDLRFAYRGDQPHAFPQAKIKLVCQGMENRMAEDCIVSGKRLGASNTVVSWAGGTCGHTFWAYVCMPQ